MAWNAQRVVSISMALLALAGLVALFNVVRRYEPAASRPAAAEEAALSAHDAVMLARKGGQPLWRVRVSAIGLRRNPESDLTEFHTAVFDYVSEGVFYQEGRPQVSFAARRATYERLPRLLDVDGGIRLESRDGEVFTAPRCQWSEREGIARFMEGGTVSIRGDRLTAPVMLYEPGGKVIRCPQGATATIRGQSVTAALLEWDLDQRLVRCQGPVTGTHGRASFVARRAELYLAKKILRVNKGSVDIRMDFE